jgi:hypothetical protein
MENFEASSIICKEGHCTTQPGLKEKAVLRSSPWGVPMWERPRWPLNLEPMTPHILHLLNLPLHLPPNVNRPCVHLVSVTMCSPAPLPHTNHPRTHTCHFLSIHVQAAISSKKSNYAIQKLSSALAKTTT